MRRSSGTLRRSDFGNTLVRVGPFKVRHGTVGSVGLGRRTRRPGISEASDDESDASRRFVETASVDCPMQFSDLHTRQDRPVRPVRAMPDLRFSLASTELLRTRSILSTSKSAA